MAEPSSHSAPTRGIGSPGFGRGSRRFPMEVYTQDDFIVAMMAISLRDTLSPEAEGFFEFIQHQRTDEEKLALLDRAEKLVDRDPDLPSRERMKELSEIFTDLPRDEWELIEIQSNSQ